MNKTRETMFATDAREAVRATWKDYYLLTKPGIIRSNMLAAFAGYWLASRWSFQWGLLGLTLLGTVLIMASSTVLNNYFDREMDKLMSRTSQRALPSGKLTPPQVLRFGIILGILGIAVLYFGVNELTALLGLIGFIVYVPIYTVWLKPRSIWSTEVGAIAGAMPPLIGYCAVTGSMDLGAWLLFAMLFLWQPPHFWTLGIRRVEEYRAAGFQILPVVKGIQHTKIRTIPYVLLLIPVSILLGVYGYVGYIFTVISVAFGLYWLYLSIAGLRAEDDNKWAHKSFLFSINYQLVTLLVMILDTPWT
jgi:protoheme IX farnesyltransferase